MNSVEAAILLVLLGGVMVGATMYASGGTETGYEYSIKAEQVEDARAVNISTVQSVKNMSDGEQELLYTAFKRSDHFLGGAEAFVRTHENYSITDGWDTVQIAGVVILYSVEKNIEQSAVDMRSLGVMIMVLCVLFLVPMVWDTIG